MFPKDPNALPVGEHGMFTMLRNNDPGRDAFFSYLIAATSGAQWDDPMMRAEFMFTLYEIDCLPEQQFVLNHPHTHVPGIGIGSCEGCGSTEELDTHGYCRTCTQRSEQQ